MTTWTPGPPPLEDGLYAVERARPDGSLSVFVAEVRRGVLVHIEFAPLTGESAVSGRILAHYRLPPLPKPEPPLPLLKQFRAKIDGRPCVGFKGMTEAHGYATFYFQDEEGWGWATERRFTDLVWINDPEAPHDD